MPSPTKHDLALQVAEDLLAELETQDIEIDKSILKAKRLARILGDSDAQSWLDLEIRGYPANFRFDQLGTCYKYAVAGGRIDPAEGKYWRQSLPELQAMVKAEHHALTAMGMPASFSPTVDNYIASGATINVLSAFQGSLQAQKQAYTQAAHLFASMKSALHAYAMETHIALQLGGAAEGIFEAARAEVDSFVRANVPKAAEQLAAIAERLREDDPESRSAALNSCRRLLLAVADSVFPPRDAQYTDSRGTSRLVGPEQYKNRILAAIDQHLTSDSAQSLLASEIDHLASRLDAVHDMSSKGVHADVTTEEARLAVIHTYLIVAEVARLSARAPT
jgi:hypothetical protein